jgi:demethylmenaquinone methyltransferase / 2-methoxy-6-polyprenyl-1,4-benzoquinol methylase
LALPVSESGPKGDARRIFSSIADQYERRGSLLSFGQDPRWRAFMVSRLRSAPDAQVVDIATGTGAVAEEITRQYGCHVTGIDQSPEMLAEARRRVEMAGLTDRVGLMEGEAERLPFADNHFDAATFTYLLRYVDDPAAVLAEIVRVVHPRGVVASLEFGVPNRRLPYLGWRVYTVAVLPVAGYFMSRGWGRAMRFLAGNIPGFYRRHPLGELVKMYRDAGLDDVRVRRLTFGAAVVIWGTKKA